MRRRVFVVARPVLLLPETIRRQREGDHTFADGHRADIADQECHVHSLAGEAGREDVKSLLPFADVAVDRQPLLEATRVAVATEGHKQAIPAAPSIAGKRGVLLDVDLGQGGGESALLEGGKDFLGNLANAFRRHRAAPWELAGGGSTSSFFTGARFFPLAREASGKPVGVRSSKDGAAARRGDP